jgi:serine/threonine-protein kinase RsbW
MTQLRSLAFGGEPSEIARATAWVAALARDGMIDAARLHDVQLCLEEALTNIVMHGVAGARQKHIEVEIATEQGRLTVEIYDDCAPFDPLARAAPPVPESLPQASIGGRGIQLMRQFSDDMRYERDAGRNHLTLVFDRAGALNPGDSATPGR